MSTSPEAVARRLIEAGFNRGDLATVEELISPDAVEHQSFGPGHPAGAEGVKAVVRSLRGAFSDFHLRIEDLVADGEKVWLRMRGTGTHDGTFMGHPPTGRPVRVDVFDVVRVVDGRVVEHWGVPDRLGALLQLGVTRPPGPAA